MTFNPSKTIDPTLDPSVRQRGLEITISHGVWSYTHTARDGAAAKRFMDAMRHEAIRRAAFYVGVAPADPNERQRRKAAFTEACKAHGVTLMTRATRELYEELKSAQGGVR